MSKSKIIDVYPLSQMQEGMLYHYLADKKSQKYFEQVSYRIEGTLELDLFEQAWNHVITSNEIFRTIFRWVGVERPVQIVLREMPLKIIFHNFSQLTPKDQLSALEELRIKDRQNQFDLAKGPTMRVLACELGEAEYEIIWSFHHILLDGWCVRVVLKELFTAYTLLANQKPLPHTQKYKYRDYIKYILQQDQVQVREYWKKNLQGFDSPTPLPVNRSKIRDITEVGRENIQLSLAESKMLEELARKAKVTVNHIIQAVWGILLSRYSNNLDVLFGVVVSGRPANLLGVEEIIGLFINTIPVRIQLNPEEQFIDLLQRLYVDSLVRQSYEHISLIDIKKVSEVQRHRQLFDCVIAYESFQDGQIMDQQQSGIRIQATSTFEMSNYDLAVRVTMSEILKIECQYNTDLFNQDTISRLLQHFYHLLMNILQHPTSRIDQLELITQAEKAQLIFDFNQTKEEYPVTQTYHQLFEEQVRRTPDKMAVELSDQQLTYHELNQHANRIADLLISKGITQDSIVPILIERSIEMIIALLGVLKAGGAYLPIDHKIPDDRLCFILKDTHATMLITTSVLQQRLLDIGIDSICLDVVDQWMMGSTVNPEVLTTPDSLAYVIYTSGSTGEPKGVLVEHRGLVNLVVSWQKHLGITKDDRGSQFASFGFDAAVFEIHPFLASGASVHIIPEMIKHSVVGLQEWLTTHRITKVFLPTAMAETVFKYIHPDQLGIKTLVIGGDYLKYLPEDEFELQILNAYGPTEDTVVSTIYNITQNPERRPIPIGKPIHNHRVYILDSQLRPVPIGISGELYLAGVGVSRGYLNRPELTQEKYLTDPFVRGERMYKTGDRGRWLADGNIEFLGRTDYQVKIRGFRIELGEIEACLIKHSAIAEVCVLIKEDEDGEKYLVAYIVLKNDLTDEELVDYLSKSLPVYQIPDTFIRLDKLPVNSSGKINLKALPEFNPELQPTIYYAPRNSVEVALERIWASTLSREKVSIKDNFFELGGHSLKAIELIAKICQEFKIELSIMDLFEDPTIEGIARLLVQKRTNHLKCVGLLKDGTGMRNLYCIHPVGGHYTGYRELAQFISPEISVYGIQALSFEDKTAPLPQSIEEMATYYVSEIRLVQPKGPYLLVGWSGGGHIAYEVARQIEAQGERIEKLIILDIPAFQRELTTKAQNPETEVIEVLLKFAPLSERRKNKIIRSGISLDELIERIYESQGFKKHYPNMELQELRRHKDIVLEINKCCINYQPTSIIMADICLYTGKDSHLKINPQDWQRWTSGQLIHRQVRGDHHTLVQQPNVQDLVEIMQL